LGLFERVLAGGEHDLFVREHHFAPNEHHFPAREDVFPANERQFISNERQFDAGERQLAGRELIFLFENYMARKLQIVISLANNVD
jgi:hypothetical protein